MPTSQLELHPRRLRSAFTLPALSSPSIRLHNFFQRDKLRTMKVRFASAVLFYLMFVGLVACFAAGGDLTAYLIDVEGGQSTLFVTPSGQSVLIDTGFPGFNGRDADRIAATAKLAGVTQIDYLLITHYHADHVGGVPAIAARLPIKNFVDHGDTVEHTPAGQKLYDDYQKEVAKGKHIVVKPGDKLPIKGLGLDDRFGGGERDREAVARGGEAEPIMCCFQAEGH